MESHELCYRGVSRDDVVKKWDKAKRYLPDPYKRFDDSSDLTRYNNLQWAMAG